MQKSIIRLNIENEIDVVLAYRRAIQLSELIGIPVSGQTKFATAVSEICRNVIEHVGKGQIDFLISEVSGQLFLEATVSDKGRGIADVHELLERKPQGATSKGQGIANSRRLVDNFKLESLPDRGTKVSLYKRVPHNLPPLTNHVVQNWREQFQNEVSVSPYAELKKQNGQLIQLLDELRLRHLEVEQQMEEITRLNQELQQAHTEVTELLQERSESNNRLLIANQNLDAFAYTVSHDLKAPLQNLEGLAFAINDSLLHGDTKDAQACSELLMEQVKKMDKFIGGVLANARFGPNKEKYLPVYTSEFVWNLLRAIKIPEGFDVTVQPDMPVIIADEVQLAQVFMNLISNAIHHHDQPTGEITITCLDKGDLVEFLVADNGPGIPPAKKEEIFKAFVKGTNRRPASSRNIGLGLSIVKRIIEAHGGTIWVESEGRGTQFRFTWPSAVVAAPVV